MLERGQNDTARHVLAEALRLNPVNLEGLKLRYQMLPGDVSTFERAEALMAIFRANPAQPEYAGAGGSIVCRRIAEDAISWYRLAS